MSTLSTLEQVQRRKDPNNKQVVQSIWNQQTQANGDNKEPATTQQGYVPSETVVAAQNKLNSLQNPGAYESQWGTQINDVIGKIMNREKFSYDLNGDALYQQYKDQYVTQGQQAMMDTIGQASALTGGYGNSYAQSVGQQTYQGYLRQLNDRVPELYQLALDQYNREGEDLYNQYGLMADRDNTEYGRHRDTVSDYLTERDYLTGRYDSERSFDYGQHRDDVADKQWQDSFDYQKDRDAVADKQWQTQFDESVRQFDTSTKIQQEQWKAEFDEGIRQFDKNYELTVQQIQEDIRHNKITEAQGQAQLDLAKQELEQRKEEFKQEMAYKYATLNKSSSSSGGSGGGSRSGGSGSGSGSGSGGSGGNGNGGGGDKPTYDSIKADLNTYIANGANKSNINTYLREALNAGYITQAQYNTLKEQFAPRGVTY